MSKINKVWVKQLNTDTYRSNILKWQLGTVVGRTSMKRYKDQLSMVDMMSGETFWTENRLLVELDSGEVVEVWQSETHVPVEASDSLPGGEVDANTKPESELAQ